MRPSLVDNEVNGVCGIDLPRAGRAVPLLDAETLLIFALLLNSTIFTTEILQADGPRVNTSTIRVLQTIYP